jgi:hypothetical protein
MPQKWHRHAHLTGAAVRWGNRGHGPLDNIKTEWANLDFHRRGNKNERYENEHRNHAYLPSGNPLLNQQRNRQTKDSLGM